MEKTTEQLQDELKAISQRIHSIQVPQKKRLRRDTRLQLQQELRNLRFQALFYLEMLTNREEPYVTMEG